MKTSYPVFRTSELSDGQLTALSGLFNEVFHKTKTPEQIRHQFTALYPNGDGFHCLVEEEGQLTAAFSCIPCRYMMDGQEVLMATTADAEVSKSSRIGAFGMKFMVDSILKAMKSAGIRFVHSFPNDTFYPYMKRMAGFRDIGVYDFYVLPLDVGEIRSSFRWLSAPVRGSVKLFCRTGAALASTANPHYRIEKIDDEPFRRQRFDERHHRLALGNGAEAVYSIYREEKIGPVAYIVDLTAHDPYSVYLAFLAVARAASGQVGLVAYPSLKLPYFLPFRVPRKRLPRLLHMTGKVLDDTLDSKALFDPASWKMNLSDFDTR